MDIIPEWAGSENDSRIFQNFRIYMRYQERLLTGAIVGDSGYACLPFLLIPIGNPTTEIQEKLVLTQNVNIVKLYND